VLQDEIVNESKTAGEEYSLVVPVGNSILLATERHLRHLLLCYMKYYNGPARIYPWRRMHRSRAPLIAPGTFFVAQSWAGCITNMPGFNLRQAQAQEARMSVNDRADNLASAVRYALETIRFEDGQKLCVRTIISNSLAHLQCLVNRDLLNKSSFTGS
jgi:hypothetical protein